MPAELHVRPASEADIDTVLGLLVEASSWLAARESDQWQRTERRRERASRGIDEGALSVVLDGTTVVGTITVDELADTDFWHRGDDVRSAPYVHRMAVARGRAGESIGSAMLAGRPSGAALLPPPGAPRRLAQQRRPAQVLREAGIPTCSHGRAAPDRLRGSGVPFERPASVQLFQGPFLFPNWPPGGRPPRDRRTTPLASPHGLHDRRRLVPA